MANALSSCQLKTHAIRHQPSTMFQIPCNLALACARARVEAAGGLPTGASSRHLHERVRGDEGLIPTDIESQIVQLYDDKRLSMQRVADRLNEDSAPTAKGGRWYASTIKRVIDRTWDQGAQVP